MSNNNNNNNKSYGDWVVYYDESSKLPYYFNLETKVTQWDRPKEVPLSAINQLSSKNNSEDKFDTTTTDKPIEEGMQLQELNVNPFFKKKNNNVTNSKQTRSDTTTRRLRNSVIRTGNSGEHIHTPSMSEVPKEVVSSLRYFPDEIQAKDSARLKNSSSISVKKWNNTMNHDSEPDWNADVAEIPRRYVILTRIFICIVAITLLWCTTLSMSKGIATTFLQSPGSRVVITNWQTVLAVGEYEMDQHRNCADRQVSYCQLLLNRTLIELQNKDEEQRSKNKQTVDDVETIAETCNADMLTVYDVTERWMNDDTLAHTITYKSGCSNEDRKNLDSNFDASSSASKSTAFFLAEKYAENQKLKIHETSNAVDARIEYDQEYLDNKTSIIRQDLDIVDSIPTIETPNIMKKVNITLPLNVLVGCLSATNDDCPQQSAVMAYRETEQAFNDTYNALQSAATENILITQAYHQSVLNKMADIESTFNKIRGASQAIKDSLMTIGVDWGNLPSTSVGTPSLTPLPTYMVIESINSVFSRMTPSFKSSFDADFTDIRNNVNAKLLEMQLKVNVSTNIKLFEDYNPPNISISTEDNDRETDEFVEQQKAVLGQVDENGDGIEANNSVTAFDSFVARAFSHNVTFSPLEFGGAMALEPLIDAIDRLIWFILLIDILYRSWKTLHLINKYMRYSAVGLPVVDVRSHTKTDEKEQVSFRGRIADFIFSPYFMVPAVILLLILSLSAIMTAYVPIYNSYQEGCIERKTGTVLTNNTHSFVMNIAKVKGDQKIDEELTRYDAKRTESCITYGDKSTSELNTRRSQLSNAKTTHQVANQNLELFEKCVDPSTFDKQGANDAANGDFWSRNPKLKRPNILVDEAWDNCHDPTPNNAVLINAIFNCSQIPDCNVICSGPNDFILRQSTFEAGCRSESLIHAAIWQSIVALLIYACLNASRILIVAAMSRLFWRSLTPFGFVFMGSCSRKGQTDSKRLKEIRAKLHEELTSFERSSVMLLLIAILVHIPYIVMFMTISNPLKDSRGFNYNYDG